MPETKSVPEISSANKPYFSTIINLEIFKSRIWAVALKAVLQGRSGGSSLATEHGTSIQ